MMESNNKIEILRNGEWVKVEPSELTTFELCDRLSYIQIDSDEFLSKQEIMESYLVLTEAIRRLENMEK